MTSAETAANVANKVNELAREIAKRCAPTNQMAQGAIEHHARAVLIEWLVPEPTNSKDPRPIWDQV